MDVSRGCVLVGLVIAASDVGCVGLLGLDHGVPEDPDGSADEASVDDEGSIVDHAFVPDGSTIRKDSGREDSPALGDAAVPDVATTADVSAAPDAVEDRTDDAPLASDASDGGCRAALQPCQVGSQCCSGVCGVGLTCL